MTDALYVFGQWIVFLMGASAVLMAGYFCWFFSHSNKSLSYAVRAFLVEQIVSSVGTLLFSLNSLLATVAGADESVWNNVHPAVAIGIRAAMFGAMLHSTVRLMWEVQKVAGELEEAKRRLKELENVQTQEN